MATVQTQAIPNNPLYGVAPIMPTLTMAADGAITLLAGGCVEITKAGVCVITLADPAINGAMLFISSKTAAAHTVTVASGLHGLGASENVGTFGGAIDDCVSLVSVNGYWCQVSNTNVTFA